MKQKMRIIGYLGRGADLRYTPQGTAVADFSVAANTGYGENKTTLWMKVTIWGKTAESLSQYLTKGKLVEVEGELQVDETGGPRTWTDSNGNTRASFEMTGRDITLLGGKGDAPAEVEEETMEIPF